MARIITASIPQTMGGYQGNLTQITKHRDELSIAEAVALARLAGDVADPLVEGGSRLVEGIMGPPQMAEKPAADPTTNPTIAARAAALGGGSGIGRSTVGEVVGSQVGNGPAGQPLSIEGLQTEQEFALQPRTLDPTRVGRNPQYMFNLHRQNPGRDWNRQLQLGVAEDDANIQAMARQRVLGLQSSAEEMNDANLQSMRGVNRSVNPAFNGRSIADQAEMRALYVDEPGADAADDFAERLAKARAPAPAVAAAPVVLAGGANPSLALTGSKRTADYAPPPAFAGAPVVPVASAAAVGTGGAGAAPAAVKRVFTLDPNHVYHYERELVPLAREIAANGTAEDRADLRKALEQSMGYGVHAKSLGGLVRGNSRFNAGEDLEKAMGPAKGSMKDELERLILAGKLAAQPHELEKTKAEVDEKRASARIKLAKADVAAQSEIVKLETAIARNQITKEQARFEADRIQAGIINMQQQSAAYASKADTEDLLAQARLDELRAKAGLEKAKTGAVPSEIARNNSEVARNQQWIAEGNSRIFANETKVVGGGGGGGGGSRELVNNDLKAFKELQKIQKAIAVKAAGASAALKNVSEDALFMLRGDGAEKAKLKLQGVDNATYGELVEVNQQVEAEAAAFKKKYKVDPREVKDLNVIEGYGESSGSPRGVITRGADGKPVYKKVGE